MTGEIRMGWVLLLAIAILFIIIVIMVEFWYIALPLCIVVPIIYLEAKHRKKQKLLEEAKREAQERCRKRMVDLGEQTIVLFEAMPNHLLSTERYLDQAEADFAKRAFDPFWDSIENAARSIGQFDESVRSVERISVLYAKLVEEYGESSPPFPLGHQAGSRLTVATATAERLQAIARKAQCDFQFAHIYGQRKTNQILIAGFNSLSAVLEDVTSRITDAIGSLAGSLRGVASTVDEVRLNVSDISKTSSKHLDVARRSASDVATRESKVLEMLDNIQRGRRPWSA